MATATPLDKATVDQLYNGWTNYKTWNTALWIRNDEAFQSIACKCKDFADFKEYLKTCNVVCTPDGVYFADEDIDAANLNTNIWGND